MKYSYHLNKIIEEEINPGKPAIIDSDRVMTWSELKEATAIVGNIVDALHVPEGHPIIIFGHKEAIFPAIMLGLMLKNIPYIPIDKMYPEDRIKKIIKISGAQIIFNCTGNEIPLFDTLTIINNKLTIDKIHATDFQAKYGTKDDPVRYIIFTSGSTGEPKGVQITKSALVSFIDWIDHDFGLGENDVFMNQAPFSFDLSVYELSMYLHFGATVVLNSIDLLQESDAFFAILKRYNQSVWVSTPSFAYLFLRDTMFNEKELPAIKTFLFCGETLPVQTAQKLLILFPDARVLNTYGPTEATVATTIVNITPDIIQRYPDALPVGYIKRETEILIDNETNDPAQPGEIIIVGDNVSIGYVGLPEINKNVFSRRNGKRAYTTGDNGYIKDGLLFHMGRMDDQVKLHGYRIELNEISAVLRNFPNVEDAVTVALKKDQQVKKIVSFIIFKNDLQLPGDEWKKDIHELLSLKLPQYMIPADFRQVKSFPISSNHKIDKKKLADLYVTGEFI